MDRTTLVETAMAGLDPRHCQFARWLVDHHRLDLPLVADADTMVAVPELRSPAQRPEEAKPAAWFWPHAGGR